MKFVYPKVEWSDKVDWVKWSKRRREDASLPTAGHPSPEDIPSVTLSVDSLISSLLLLSSSVSSPSLLLRLSSSVLIFLSFVYHPSSFVYALSPLSSVSFSVLAGPLFRPARWGR